MWRPLSRKKNQDECGCLRDALENVADLAALSSAHRDHLAACPACQQASSDISITRVVFRDVPARAASPGPWFAPRVMAAIAARESELRQSLDTWAAVPRLAARLSWISALALVLASTLLYELPKPAPNPGNESAAESLFDSQQSSAPQDDVVLPLEKAR